MGRRRLYCAVIPQHDLAGLLLMGVDLAVVGPMQERNLRTARQADSSASHVSHRISVPALRVYSQGYRTIILEDIDV